MKIETVDIDNNAGMQSVRLPDGLQINDNKVYIKKLGNIVYLIPFHTPWQNFFESLNSFSDDFMAERSQPMNQPRESLD